MRQIIINVEDSAYECVMGTLQLCQQVEVVRVDMLQDMEESDVDVCFMKAIKELQDDRVIRNQYDYAFIYLAIREGAINEIDAFYSVKCFVDYLRDLGINNPPSKNSISNICTHTQGEFPEWLFLDEKVDVQEERRRRNIVNRFSSAFGRFMRGVGR